MANHRFLVCTALTTALVVDGFPALRAQQADRQDRKMASHLKLPGNDGVFLPVEESYVPKDGAPGDAFKGCTAPKPAGASQAQVTDPISQRTFAQQGIGAGEVSNGNIGVDCRMRLDGIWVQDAPLGLDRTKQPTNFAAAGRDALNPSLANGNFTTPVYLDVEMANGGRTLSIRPASRLAPPIALRSADNVPLVDVFRPNGARKAYLFPGQSSPDLTSSLFVDTTRTGRVRMRVSGTDFYRPQPLVKNNPQETSADAWMIGFNLDNLGANRRGYDIVTQDPFRLNDNLKSDIFATVNPSDYAIVEKRTVPLGLKLVAQGEQGTIASETLISSEREYQSTVGSSFGLNVGFTKTNADGDAVGSAAAGASYASQKTSGMRSGEISSMAVGYARHKLYALVLDQPFAKLSDAFIDAIADATRYPGQSSYDAIIAKFGTHYPYAITYGSAAKMEAGFTQETVANWAAAGQSSSTQAGFAIAGFGAQSSSSGFTQSSEQNSQLKSAKTITFDAVGGTGSFSELGHSTGTPYPILADLRPLHELLNPINFPGEPEIYGTVRADLEAAITRYLEENSTSLSDESYAPKLQTWVISAPLLECRKIGAGIGDGNIGEVYGTITVNVELPKSLPKAVGFTPFNRSGRNSYWNINCPGAGRKMIGSMRVSGTAQQLEDSRVVLMGNIRERDDVGLIHADYAIAAGARRVTKIPVSGSPVGAQHERYLKLTGAPGAADIRVKVTMQRVE